MTKAVKNKITKMFVSIFVHIFVDIVAYVFVVDGNENDKKMNNKRILPD